MKNRPTDRADSAGSIQFRQFYDFIAILYRRRSALTRGQVFFCVRACIAANSRMSILIDHAYDAMFMAVFRGMAIPENAWPQSARPIFNRKNTGNTKRKTWMTQRRSRQILISSCALYVLCD
jgi:hypothetical protein